MRTCIGLLLICWFLVADVCSRFLIDAPFNVKCYERSVILNSNLEFDCAELFWQIDNDPSSFNFVGSFTGEHSVTTDNRNEAYFEGHFGHGTCDIRYSFSLDVESPAPDGGQLWKWMRPLWEGIESECLEKANTLGTASQYDTFAYLTIHEDNIQNMPLFGAFPSDTDPETVPLLDQDTAVQALNTIQQGRRKSPCSWLCNMPNTTVKATCSGLQTAMEHLASDYIAFQLLLSQEESKWPKTQLSVVVATIYSKGSKFITTIPESYEIIKNFTTGVRMSEEQAQEACITARWTATKGLLSGIEGMLLIAAGATNCDSIGANAAAVGIVFDGAMAVTSAVMDLAVGFCQWNAKTRADDGHNA